MERSLAGVPSTIGDRSHATDIRHGEWRSYQAGEPLSDINELFRRVATEPYEHRGILHSELALIIFVARALGIERFVESGRARAQSTYILGKYLPDVEIHSVDARDGPDERYGRDRVLHMANIELYQGDGMELVPQIVDDDERQTAILLDGPKGHAALDLIETCFQRPHVRVGFIHDMRRLDHGEPSPYRAAAEARFEISKFSDDPALVAGTSWMDANALNAGGPCGQRHEAEFGSYGPTIGAFFNPQQ